MQDHNQLTIHDIGKWLEWRRSNNAQTILLLGSRTGALYRSLTFYQKLLQNTSQQFYTRPLIHSFRECYNTLIHNPLGERELHTLLQDSLKSIAALLDSYYDIYCSELIKRGYFREIISTNIDDLIEQALLNVGLIEGKDFMVFIPEKQQSFSVKRDFPYRLTKVFGDLHSREYAMNNRQSYLTEKKGLEQYLQGLLSGDVLAIGVDMLWDGSILPFLKQFPNSLWFVNDDEDIISDQQVTSLFNQKKTAALIHYNYEYKEVWRLLYPQLCKEKPDTTIRSSPFPKKKVCQLDYNPLPYKFPTPNNNDAIRTLYIYCDKDIELMQKFWQHLQTLRLEHLITEWHRGLLIPGDHLQLAQERELRRARLIFVGFSSQFLSSEYYEQAIQALNLTREDGGTVSLVPLRLRPIGNWNLTPFSHLASLPREEKALSNFNSNDLDRELSKIAKEIYDHVLRLKKCQE